MLVAHRLLPLAAAVGLTRAANGGRMMAGGSGGGQRSPAPRAAAVRWALPPLRPRRELTQLGIGPAGLRPPEPRHLGAEAENTARSQRRLETGHGTISQSHGRLSQGRGPLKLGP